MPYPPMMVQPMREELTRLGFRELSTPEEVDREIAASGEPLLLVVNSICGCAAGVARPGRRPVALPSRGADAARDGLRRPGRRGDRAGPQLLRGLPAVLAADRDPRERPARPPGPATRDRGPHGRAGRGGADGRVREAAEGRREPLAGRRSSKRESLPASLLPVLHDLPRRVRARRPGDSAARMRARAAEIEARDRGPVARPAEERAHREELVERVLAVEDVAARRGRTSPRGRAASGRASPRMRLSNPGACSATILPTARGELVAPLCPRSALASVYGAYWTRTDRT